MSGFDVAQFGAVYDGTTDSRQALVEAIAAASQGKEKVIIRGPLYLRIVSDTDSIALPSDAHIVFEGGGSIKYDNIVVPTFYTNGADNVRIDDAVVYYAGQMTTDAPWRIAPYNAYFAGFYDNVLRRADPAASQIPGTSAAACFFFCGGSSIQVNRPRFVAVGSTSPQFFPNCIVACDGNDGTPIRDVTIRSPVLDGCIMGILAWRIDGLYLSDVVSRRYGAYAWDWAPPPHILYVSPNKGAIGGSRNIVVRGVHDHGIDRSAMDAGQVSLKIVDVDGVMVSNVHSARQHGLMDLSARSGCISNLFWTGVYARTVGGSVRPFRFINPNGAPRENANLEISGLHLEMSDAITDSVISAPSSTGDQVGNVVMRNVTIKAPSVSSSSSPVIVGGFSDCLFDVNYGIGSGPAFTILLRVDGGGSRNRLMALLSGLDLSSVRVLENAAAPAAVNSAAITDARTGAVRQIAL